MKIVVTFASTRVLRTVIKGALFEYIGAVKVARRTEGIEKRKKKVDCVGGPRFHFVPPLPFFFPTLSLLQLWYLLLTSHFISPAFQFRLCAQTLEVHR